MKFVETTPSLDTGLREWVCGPYTVAELAFLLGQRRIQIWHSRPHYSYPDMVPPNF